MDSHPETPQWTAARLAAAAPTWEPDLGRARRLIRARPAARSRRLMYATAGATAALIVAFVSPSSRALAQDLWYRWFVTRVAVVRVDFSRIPLDTSIRTDGLQQTVASLAEAAGLAGFTPVLPPPDVAGGAPALSIVGRIDVTQRIRARALEDALRREGATDVDVPVEWDGTTLRAVIGPLVAANYPGEVEVLQTVPIRLEMPAAFPLERFAEISFRAGGLPKQEARELAKEYAKQPAWLLDIASDEGRDRRGRSTLAGGGSALLLEDPNESGGERVTVIISRPTRVYSASRPEPRLEPPDRELAALTHPPPSRSPTECHNHRAGLGQVRQLDSRRSPRWLTRQTPEVPT